MLSYGQVMESEADRLKFVEIYTTYERHMHRVAYRILHNQHDAEDAVHSAFVIIARNIRGVRCKAPRELQVYLTLIVEHRAYNILKTSRKYKLVDLEAPEFADDAALSYDIPLPGDGGLADALAKIHPRYRDVIMLRYYNDLSTREIAAILEIKENSVQKLLQRARDALQKQLDKEEQHS